MSATRLGNYDLIKPLASGGMAEVCAARDRTTGEVVIVKRMLPQFTSSPEFVEMFLDEGRTVALLRHPNVVRMLDFGFHGDLPYLAMEYLHGVDLRTLMRAVAKRGELLPLGLALGIVAALCAGLHHAHQARALDGRVLDIVHRDVSPQNLVITFEGGIKLIDFGIAKSRDRIHETRAGGLKGKVPYMSPEQIRATSVDHRTDIYAAGVVLYELVTGRRPYLVDARNAEPQGEFALMMAIVGHQIVKPSTVAPDLPLGVEEVLLRSLAPQPGHRYATAEEMQRALVRVAEELDQPFDVDALRALVLTRFGERDRKWRQALQQDDELVTIIEASRREQDVHEDDHDPPSVVSTGHRSADLVVMGTASIPLTTGPTRERRDDDLPRVVAFGPRLDERFRGAERAADLEGTVVLDLAGLERISSYGVREWLDLHRTLGARPAPPRVYLARCSEAFIAQLAVIRGFAGAATLVSFLAPYLCGQCGHGFRHLFDCELDAAALSARVPPLIPCPRCQTPASLDDDPAYLAPIRARLGVVVPPIVRAVLAQLVQPEEAGGATKQVEGELTRVVISSFEPGFRWPRLLDGVEGTLEIDLREARVDAAAAAATLAALRSLDADVIAVRLLGAPLQLVDAALPRTVIVSVQVEGRCPTCAAPRTVVIEPAQLAQLRTGRAPALLCRRCDTPLDAVDLAPAPVRSTQSSMPRLVAEAPPRPPAEAPAGEPMVPADGPRGAPRERRPPGWGVVLGAGLMVGGVVVALLVLRARTPAASTAEPAASAPLVIAMTPSVPAVAAPAAAADVQHAGDRWLAVGHGAGPDGDAALQAARGAALRHLIGHLEAALPAELRALGGAATDAALVDEVTAALGATVAFERVAVTPTPDGGLDATYALADLDRARALAYYGQRETAWGATFVHAPPSRPRGVLVLAPGPTALRPGDRIVRVDGQAVPTLQALTRASRRGTLVLVRDGAEITVTVGDPT